MQRNPFVILIRVALPLAIVAGGVFTYELLKSTAPEPSQRPAPRAVPTVEIGVLTATDYQVMLSTQGIVEPRTESLLTAEVSGKIAEVSDAFREGGFFDKDDVLVRVDSRDYENAVVQAEAALTRAETTRKLEEAQAAKAAADWKALGRGSEPGDLVLRKPQLAQAQADVNAARASLNQAKLDLERTEIRSPYRGRVLAKNADIGQYISPGTQLGQIFATDFAEIRLPLRESQLPFVQLPYLDSHPSPPVALFNGETDAAQQWDGFIDRSEAAVDARTRQLFVVARVPYPDPTVNPQAVPLPTGLFVEAKIKGTELKDIFIIPRSAVREGNKVITLDDDNLARFKPLDVIYADDKDYLIASSGGALKEGERISLTPLPFVEEGAELRVKGEASPERKGRPGDPTTGKPGLAGEDEKNGKKPKT